MNELLDALKRVASVLDILAGTKRKAGCSDATYRKVVSAQIDGIMASGTPEVIAFAIEELNKPRGRTAKKQKEEMTSNG